MLMLENEKCLFSMEFHGLLFSRTDFDSQIYQKTDNSLALYVLSPT